MGAPGALGAEVLRRRAKDDQLLSELSSLRELWRLPESPQRWRVFLMEIGGPEADDLTYIRCLAFSPDGGSIAVGGTASGQVSILDVASSPHKSNPRILLEDPWDGPVTQVAFSPSGRHLISKVDAPLREALSRIVIRDFLTGETLAVLKEKSNIRCFACSPDGTRIASGQQDNTVRVWDRVPSSGTVTDFPQGRPNPAESRAERTRSRFFGNFVSTIQGVFARERGSEE